MRYKPYILLVIICCLASCKQQKTADSIKTPANKETEAFLYEHLVREPLEPTANPALLILLHGYGSQEKDLYSFVDHLDPKLLVVCPRAPISLTNDKYCWYQLNTTSANLRYKPDEVIQVSKDLVLYTQQLINHFKADKNKVFLGGFSQGAILSLGTALNHSTLFDGAICLSGQLYPEFMSSVTKNSIEDGLDLFISHGKQDQVLPISTIEKNIKELKEKGIEPSYFTYDSGHTITAENFMDMLNWLNKQLSKS